MRMEVPSSSYSRAASPFSSGAVDRLAGDGAGARRSPEKKCAQILLRVLEGGVRVHVHVAIITDRDTTKQKYLKKMVTVIFKII